MKVDEYNLERFAQAQMGSYEQALREIRLGRKTSHWMWYIFPQMAGLGTSSTAQFYGLRSLDEARAYLDHAVLGPRLVTCAEAAMDVEGRNATQIFGTPDDLKLRSSATLFSLVSPPDSVFHQILAKFFGGRPDPRTVKLSVAAR